MPKYIIRIMTMLFLLLCGVTAYAQPQWQLLPETINKSDRDPRQYKAIQLQNGMIVLLVSDEKAIKSLAAVSIPVGHMENPDNQLGLAHYLEHMVLMGSKRYPQPGGFAEFLQKNGGSHNATTTAIRTAFYLEVENSALPEATDRLANALAEPLLDPVNADRERHAVDNEMTIARAGEGHRIWQIRSETINPAHPNARFAGGNLETLSDKPESKLQTALIDFYQRYYSANLMKGVIYGNQSIDKLAQMAAETFGRIPNRQASVPAVTVPVVTEKEKGVVIHYVPAQPYKALRLEFSIADNSADFRSKTDGYIGYLIGNHSQNTLSDWLQKQGLIEGISASASPRIDGNAGTFGIYVSLTDKGLAQRDQVLAAIFSYINLLKQKGIQKSYFDEMTKVLDLSFQYASIVRNMNYIEGLSDAMLQLPIAHVLDAEYVADAFNPQAIASRLDELTPENAHIWFISPTEPHNKEAYFVQAPYQVNKITQKQVMEWNKVGQGMSFSLPELNPYIPDDLPLIKTSGSQKHPKMILEQPNVRLLYMPSQYFADEPKGSITLEMRNPDGLKNIKDQLTEALLVYLSDLSLDQLGYQASVGGMGIFAGYADGLKIGVSGYTQHLPELLTSAISQYTSFMPTQEELNQAKSWYREQIEVTNNRKAFQMAMLPVSRLSSIPYFEQAEKLKELDNITVDDIVKYRQNMIQHSALQALIFGNFTEQQSIDIVQSAQKQLANQGTVWWSGDDIVIDRSYAVDFKGTANSTDNALAEIYIPTGYDRIRGGVYSNLLSSILSPWFYDQLRTTEQLGYAVFAFNQSVGHQWGLGFLLQSNSKQPDYLHQRYQKFYQQADKKLKAMSEAEFEQYKKSLLAGMHEPPQTFYSELDNYYLDFGLNNFKFDTRTKAIAAMEKATKAQMIEFYEKAVIKRQGLALISQITGEKGTAHQYAELKGWKTYKYVSDFQKRLPVKVNVPAKVNAQ
ncbi:pitrilysin [Xenorhabdus nematophila]|uniref:Protease 3 n=1 Tax=Xenorhabdus nematophila (strain ATCC 19061 / DSM 3370 / CCUG 14189 / LMG 1036 / NCIMB 9965 / AN6) TaxID=406817 RepID=D3VCM7_XENNA|nr:pitrilysin [Xenorhabdus nematophila]CEF28945.1 protease III [Xenorhabdus nematophila str. Websteri]AYA42126.1 pitrilysin [Xenorhabdus nematophila]MBA0020849.1 pitrilysin [Xenorhabdus nematophila]MCB4424097.1 pitrilysin [Xenorhabdus nematophila]QNJ36498.1 pitrilysin [Xenorhabdus nematophila]